MFSHEFGDYMLIPYFDTLLTHKQAAGQQRKLHLPPRSTKAGVNEQRMLAYFFRHCTDKRVFEIWHILCMRPPNSGNCVDSQRGQNKDD